MRLIHSVVDLQNALWPLKQLQKSVGFVPTMGALHQGHMSLVKKCLESTDVCVVSIFVNPTQFNDKNDYNKYPRTLDRDVQLLEEEGVDFIFAPSEKDVYPEPDARQFDFGLLDKVMEGKHRSGHFNGVAQVVSRLFDIVKPNKAYFGEKDFQQLAIIRSMVKQLNIPVEIIGMPILREDSGLALSSRNERLTKGQKAIATKIYATIKSSIEAVSTSSVKETIRSVIATINREEELNVEYYDIVDGYTLQPIKNWSETNYAVGCIAVFCGDVRLIDNITYFNQN